MDVAVWYDNKKTEESFLKNKIQHKLIDQIHYVILQIYNEFLKNHQISSLTLADKFRKYFIFSEIRLKDNNLIPYNIMLKERNNINLPNLKSDPDFSALLKYDNKQIGVVVEKYSTQFQKNLDTTTKLYYNII